MSHARFIATPEGRFPECGALRSSLSEGSAADLTLLFLLSTKIWQKFCGPSGKPNATSSRLERRNLLNNVLCDSALQHGLGLSLSAAQQEE